MRRSKDRFLKIFYCMIAAIEKKRKKEEAERKASQGWSISSWWSGSSGTTGKGQPSVSCA